MKYNLFWIYFLNLICNYIFVLLCKYFFVLLGIYIFILVCNYIFLFPCIYIFILLNNFILLYFFYFMWLYFVYGVFYILVMVDCSCACASAVFGVRVQFVHYYNSGTSSYHFRLGNQCVMDMPWRATLASNFSFMCLIVSHFAHIFPFESRTSINHIFCRGKSKFLIVQQSILIRQQISFSTFLTTKNIQRQMRELKLSLRSESWKVLQDWRVDGHCITQEWLDASGKKAKLKQRS